MINKMNHRNGIVLPNGEYYEARVGSTRWFNAERAERALAEVRPEVDRAVELVNRAFNTENAIQAVKTVAVLKNRFLFIFDCIIATSAVPDAKVIRIMTGNVTGEELNEMAAKWQATLEKNASKLYEMAVKVAMRYVKEGHWQFWSKNGWFEQVEVEVEEAAEVEEQEEVEEQAAEVESNEQSSENNEPEEVKAEVEEEVSTGRLVARMFDASNPERAFAAMVKIVNGGLNIQRTLGFSFSKMNVGGKVKNIGQVAYEVMNKTVTPEFRNAAVAAWKALLDRTERLHRCAADTAEALGVEVENEPEEVEAIEKDEQNNENSEVEMSKKNTVDQERLSDKCIANVGGCRVQADTPEDMVRIDRALRCLRAVLREEKTLDGFLEMAGRHGNVVTSESFLARAESVKEGRQRFFPGAKTEDLSSYLKTESGKGANIRRNGAYTWAARKDGAVLEVWVQGEKGVLWWKNTLRE